ncbi:hypothetical protein GQ42DRAFT_164126, partial [Ramicandelaber brevisporus]
NTSSNTVGNSSGSPLSRSVGVSHATVHGSAVRTTLNISAGSRSGGGSTTSGATSRFVAVNKAATSTGTGTGTGTAASSAASSPVTEKASVTSPPIIATTITAGTTQLPPIVTIVEESETGETAAASTSKTVAQKSPSQSPPVAPPPKTAPASEPESTQAQPPAATLAAASPSEPASARPYHLWPQQSPSFIESMPDGTVNRRVEDVLERLFVATLAFNYKSPTFPTKNMMLSMESQHQVSQKAFKRWMTLRRAWQKAYEKDMHHDPTSSDAQIKAEQSRQKYLERTDNSSSATQPTTIATTPPADSTTATSKSATAAATATATATATKTKAKTKTKTSAAKSTSEAAPPANEESSTIDTRPEHGTSSTKSTNVSLASESGEEELHARPLRRSSRRSSAKKIVESPEPMDDIQLESEPEPEPEPESEPESESEPSSAKKKKKKQSLSSKNTPSKQRKQSLTSTKNSAKDEQTVSIDSGGKEDEIIQIEEQPAVVAINTAPEPPEPPTATYDSGDDQSKLPKDFTEFIDTVSTINDAKVFPRIMKTLNSVVGRYTFLADMVDTHNDKARELFIRTDGISELRVWWQHSFANNITAIINPIQNLLLALPLDSEAISRGKLLKTVQKIAVTLTGPNGRTFAGWDSQLPVVRDLNARFELVTLAVVANTIEAGLAGAEFERAEAKFEEQQQSPAKHKDGVHSKKSLGGMSNITTKDKKTKRKKIDDYNDIDNVESIEESVESSDGEASLKSRGRHRNRHSTKMVSNKRKLSIGSDENEGEEYYNEEEEEEEDGVVHSSRYRAKETAKGTRAKRPRTTTSPAQLDGKSHAKSEYSRESLSSSDEDSDDILFDLSKKRAFIEAAGSNADRKKLLKTHNSFGSDNETEVVSSGSVLRSIPAGRTGSGSRFTSAVGIGSGIGSNIGIGSNVGSGAGSGGSASRSRFDVGSFLNTMRGASQQKQKQQQQSSKSQSQHSSRYPQQQQMSTSKSGKHEEDDISSGDENQPNEGEGRRKRVSFAPEDEGLYATALFKPDAPINELIRVKGLVNKDTLPYAATPDAASDNEYEQNGGSSGIGTQINHHPADSSSSHDTGTGRDLFSSPPPHQRPRFLAGDRHPGLTKHYMYTPSRSLLGLQATLARYANAQVEFTPPIPLDLPDVIGNIKSASKQIARECDRVEQHVKLVATARFSSQMMNDLKHSPLENFISIDRQGDAVKPIEMRIHHDDITAMLADAPRNNGETPPMKPDPLGKASHTTPTPLKSSSTSTSVKTRDENRGSNSSSSSNIGANASTSNNAGSEGGGRSGDRDAQSRNPPKRWTSSMRTARDKRVCRHWYDSRCRFGPQCVDAHEMPTKW